MTEAISQQLIELNNQRHYKATLLVYARRDQNDTEETDAHMHFQAAVASLMLGRPTGEIEACLEACPNYSSDMRGDLKRDIALSIIRQGVEHERAMVLINEAMQLHRNSPARLAVDEQAVGRFLEAQYDNHEAYTTLRHALEQLQRAREPFDTIWLSNTAFHLVRVAIKNGYRARARQALGVVVAHDPSWRKRWAARAMYYLPAGLGVKIVARLT